MNQHLERYMMGLSPYSIRGSKAQDGRPEKPECQALIGPEQKEIVEEGLIV
jgi:hypothetical protein